MSFRYIAPFSIVIVIVFGILYLRDRAGGGYKEEAISADSGGSVTDAHDEAEVEHG